MITRTYPVDVMERVTIARIWDDANVEALWRLWTTKTGIESWWGPEGAAVKVQKLDLRPEGAGERIGVGRHLGRDGIDGLQRDVLELLA